MTAVNHPEREHQQAFFCWLRINEARHPQLKRFFAIPNGEKRDRVTAAVLYGQGVRRGVLDTFLPAKGTYQGREFAGLWIEFKAGKNKLTEEQCDWVGYLTAAGYSVHVVCQWTDAARITRDYLELKIQVPN